MMGNSFNPYRQRAVQNQQHHGQPQQPRPQTIQGQRPRGGHRVRDDFGDEWKDRDVVIEHVKGQVVSTIKGRVVDVSKYWLKLFVNNQILYLNKAYVVSIKPAEIERGALGGDNAGGK
jgi:hypothetical protein